jgi:nitroreductase
MDVYEAIRTRRSVRAYQSKTVEDEKLRRIFEATRLAPSASNRQPWKFIIVRDEKIRRDLIKAANGQQFVGEAPVVVAAVALRPEHIMSCDVPSYAVDLAIAIDHITLAAVAEGLGTCWIGAFNQQKTREILKIPESCKIVALLPLGYPAGDGGPKMRKSLEEIVCYDKFQE